MSYRAPAVHAETSSNSVVGKGISGPVAYQNVCTQDLVKARPKQKGNTAYAECSRHAALLSINHQKSGGSSRKTDQWPEHLMSGA